METAVLQTFAEMEDSHWWYRQRKAMVSRLLAKIGPGCGRWAVDVGAGAGGHVPLLRDHGWRPLAVEYNPDGAVMVARRGAAVVRADGRALPLRTDSADLAIALDVLEHIDQDDRAAAELRRVLRPGGSLVVTVPASLSLWSAHDEAVSHMRRYSRSSIGRLLRGVGLRVTSIRSWNVLLRPAMMIRRRSQCSADIGAPPPWINGTLNAVSAVERYLPVGRMPGVSLVVTAVAQ